jgi:F0F1-type ATP synthase membrane subunit c/vacuolar-type H+-ATPase subunit K
VRAVRAISGLWRWRGNPLRRGTDLAEAWLALAAALLILVASPVAGVVTGTLGERALLRTVAEQHRDRHRVRAVVVRTVHRAPPDHDPETVAARNAHSAVVATWRAPDCTAHRGVILTGLRPPPPGARLTIWTDAHGAVVARPLDTVSASTHAVLAGVGVCAALAGLLDGARRLIMWRIVRRRYACWDEAWQKAGPDWGRAGTGS